jgi:TolB-like protein/Tfp pilus assembly protein PilF
LNLFNELKRRKVIRVGVAYVAVAWLSLQVAEILLPAYGFTDAAIRNLVAILAVGLVVALLLAWVFDWTGKGVEVTAAVGEEQAAAATSARAPNAAIAALVLMAVLAAAFLTWRSMDDIPRSARTIAVLPFATLGMEKADVFTDGMHVGVLTRLSGVHELDVISRTSVLSYRDSNLSLPEIAGQLGAQWVLNADVQQGLDEVLVSVRLSDARKDRQVWAENYRRTLTATNLFQIQADIARRIIDELQAELTDVEQSRLAVLPTGNLEAYRLYRLGTSRLDLRSRDDMWAAVDLFEEAIERDPDYALAWAGLGDALGSLVGYRHESGVEILARAQNAVDRAMQLDRELAEAWNAAGNLAYLRRDGPGALNAFVRATELRPSYAQAYVWINYMNGLFGNTVASQAAAARAVALNPMSPEAATNFAASSMALGQQELALSEARRARELAPGWPNTRFVVGMLLYHAGRYEEAVMELRELSIPWVEMGAETHLALSYAALGKETEARAVQQIVEASDDIYAKASLRAALDGLDAGYAALADLQDWSDWPTLDFRNLGRPLWDPQGADPRYAEILHAIDASWGRKE